MTIYTKATLILLGGSLSSLADIQLPAFFSDGMVLQQETGAKIWGTCDTGKNVEVKFAGTTLSSKVDAKGKWIVDFKGLKMSKKGAVLTITSGSDKREINDVVVGEVWLASGQSNMEWNVRSSTSLEDSKTANDALLRVYVSGNVTAIKPVNNFKGVWQHTNPKNTARFTAVGYEFAKNLRMKLDVPVGIIECAWGGQPVESFISQEAIKSLPEGKALVLNKASAIKKYNPVKAEKDYSARLEKWKLAMAEWKKVKQDKIAKKVRRPRQPRMAMNPALSPRQHSTIYNGMIAPLAGYGVRGAIWYQGESNANKMTAGNYGELLNCMIQDWRKQWGHELSFYYVQLANFERRKKNSPLWVVVQDEMRRLLEGSTKIGMAVINDIGDNRDIHPKNKKDVGARLARWALNQDYGKTDVIVSGPLYKSHSIKGAIVEVSFDYNVGLKSRDGKDIGSFELSNAEGKWFSASAVVKGNKVLVSSKEVGSPKNVRYAWKSDPTKANLVNVEGLPTSCFTGK